MQLWDDFVIFVCYFFTRNCYVGTHNWTCGPHTHIHGRARMRTHSLTHSYSFLHQPISANSRMKASSDTWHVSAEYTAPGLPYPVLERWGFVIFVPESLPLVLVRLSSLASLVAAVIISRKRGSTPDLVYVKRNYIQRTFSATNPMRQQTDFVISGSSLKAGLICSPCTAVGTTENFEQDDHLTKAISL